MKRGYIISFILGAIIFSGITAFATTQIVASNISYKNTTVESAIDDLYTKAKPDYDGTVIYTPSDTTQTIPTQDKILRSNIIINQIPSSYKQLSSLTNELTASDLLSGKQAYSSNGTVVNGSITTFTPESSYIPTTTAQTLSTNGKYVNGDITIGSIPSSYKELNTVTTVTANKLLSGETAYDNLGNLITGSYVDTSLNSSMTVDTNNTGSYTVSGNHAKAYIVVSRTAAPIFKRNNVDQISISNVIANGTSNVYSYMYKVNNVVSGENWYFVGIANILFID